MNSPRYNPDSEADICLLLEGTFPYVRGGVSSWVRQIIEGMPERRFSIVYLGATADEHTELAYDLPDNVVHLEQHFLLQSATASASKSVKSAKSTAAAKANKAAGNTASKAANKSNGKAVPKKPFWKPAVVNQQKYAQNRELHDCLKIADSSAVNRSDATANESLATAAAGFTELLCGDKAISEHELQSSKPSWQTIRESYQDAPAGLDFNHYFWTVRSMHAPLFILGEIARQAPKAAIYHSVSTGYAGFLGGMLHHQTGTPFLISEHGIYTKERELDLAQVDWIPEDLDPFKVGLNDNMSYLRNTWIRFFRSLGRMSYSAASRVFTLYEGNRLRQIADGAPANKLSIIPNGVNVERFRAVRVAQRDHIPPVLALIGRVVPIKDIKNFIRAMRVIRSEIPDAEAWLVGPQDEDPAYTEECKMLVDSLDLSSAVKFLGFQNPEDLFPQIGLSVLTSVSEGQPLVVLEGFAAGIPAVTTDVGSCHELIHGVDPDDIALGSAGAVVPIADPSAFAIAAVELLTDSDKWLAASRSAIARVERYYDETDMIHRYQQVYQQASEQVPGQTSGSLHSACSDDQSPDSPDSLDSPDSPDSLDNPLRKAS